MYAPWLHPVTYFCNFVTFLVSHSFFWDPFLTLFTFTISTEFLSYVSFVKISKKLSELIGILLETLQSDVGGRAITVGCPPRALVTSTNRSGSRLPYEPSPGGLSCFTPIVLLPLSFAGYTVFPINTNWWCSRQAVCRVVHYWLFSSYVASVYFSRS